MLQKRQKRLQRIRVRFFFTVNFVLISCFSGIQQQNETFLQAEDKGDDDGISDSIFPPLKKSKFAAPILSDDEIAMVEELDLPEKVNSLDSDNIMEEDKSDQTMEHLVFEGPVSGLEKDRNWTGLDRKKTGLQSQSLIFKNQRPRKDRFKPVLCTP